MTESHYQSQSDSGEPPPDTEDQARGYQVEVISTPTLIAWGCGILGLLVFATGVSFALWYWLEVQTPHTELVVDEEQNPLDPKQRETRLNYEREQQELLSTFGWVEPERDIVRVPLERAMELFLERTNP